MLTKGLQSDIFINSIGQFHTYYVAIGNLSTEQPEPVRKTFDKDPFRDIRHSTLGATYDFPSFLHVSAVLCMYSYVISRC